MCESTLINATKIMFTYTPFHHRKSLRASVSVLLGIVISIGINLSMASTLNAHDEFKEVLERRYRLKSVSCKACHTDKKDKKIRNAFGKLFDKELKGKNLTKRYLAAKEEGDEAKRQFEKKMIKEFAVALNAVEKKPVTFLALMEAGLLSGTRLDKNLVDADTLTIKTLSDSEVEAIKFANASVIKGEIKQMPVVTDKPPTPQPKKKQKKPAPASKPDTNNAKPKTDDKTVDKSKLPPSSDDIDTPE